MLKAFLIKIDKATISNLIRRIGEFNSPKEELTLIIFCEIGIMV